MSAAAKKVNLLVREGFEYTTLGRVLTWALSAGRVIVILTELVVIAAFLSRFWLDRVLTDLNEANNNKRKQIEASGRFENDFRALQDRLVNYKKLAQKTEDSAKISQIASLLPADVSLKRISISKKDLQVTGFSLSEGGLAGLIKGLADSKKYENVQLDGLSLSTEGQQGFVFTIKGTVAGKAKEAKK